MVRRPAFTLIEMMIVLGIIALLAVLLILQLTSSRLRATNVVARTDVSDLGKSVEIWRVTTSQIERAVNAGGATAGNPITYVNGSGENTTCVAGTIEKDTSCGGWKT